MKQRELFTLKREKKSKRETDTEEEARSARIRAAMARYLEKGGRK